MMPEVMELAVTLCQGMHTRKLCYSRYVHKSVSQKLGNCSNGVSVTATTNQIKFCHYTNVKRHRILLTTSDQDSPPSLSKEKNQTTLQLKNYRVTAHDKTKCSPVYGKLITTNFKEPNLLRCLDNV